MTIRKPLAVAWLAAAAAGVGFGASAQEFPSRALNMIVGFNPGGGTDTLARLVAAELENRFNYQVIVENRAGADGTIAAELVSQAAPDGYTLAVITNGHTISPNLYDLTYEPIEDFTPITMMATQPNLLVLHPSVPVNSVQELIDYANENPGVLNYGSSGTGTSPYWVMQLLISMSGIDMVHIPYSGGAPAVLAVLNNDIDALFVAVTTGIEQVAAGGVKAIAVSSPERNPAVPDLPTVAETLPGFAGATWYGFLAPAGLPRDIAEKLNADITAIIQSPEINEQLINRGLTPVGNSLDEFRAFMQADIDRWRSVAEAIGN